MAVEDKYTNANVEAGKLANPALGGGGAQTISMVETVEVAAADDDNSVYRFFANVSPTLIPKSITVMCDAITLGTDYNLGLFNVNSGAVIDDNIFADALNLSSASRVLDGLENVGIESLTKKIYEHAGHTIANMKQGYDIGLTGITVGSAAGTITIIAEFIQG